MGKLLQISCRRPRIRVGVVNWLPKYYCAVCRASCSPHARRLGALFCIVCFNRVLSSFAFDLIYCVCCVAEGAYQTKISVLYDLTLLLIGREPAKISGRLLCSLFLDGCDKPPFIVQYLRPASRSRSDCFLIRTVDAITGTFRYQPWHYMHGMMSYFMERTGVNAVIIKKKIKKYPREMA